MVNTAPGGPLRHRFLCPRCHSALTPWLRELTWREALCVEGDDTSLVPAGHFVHRDAAGVDWTPEAFPWLLAPLGAKWLVAHPDPARTVGCCGLAFLNGAPNLLCPRGHEVGAGYRDCLGPHWYALSEEVERQSERDPSPPPDPAPALERARALAAAPPPSGLEHFADRRPAVRPDATETWLDALWLEAPSLALTGGEASPALVARATGLPPGRALLWPAPWPLLARLLCLDVPPFGDAEAPLGWRGGDGPTVNVVRGDALVLLTSHRRHADEAGAFVFDAAEWSDAWARLKRAP
jgi:hypothetical protein